jgi:hypothetical protein
MVMTIANELRFKLVPASFKAYAGRPYPYGRQPSSMSTENRFDEAT